MELFNKQKSAHQILLLLGTGQPISRHRNMVMFLAGHISLISQSHSDQGGYKIYVVERSVLEIRSRMRREFLNAGNPNKIITAYSSVLDVANIEAIKGQSKLHTAAMYKLGVIHYRFATSLTRPHWRQKISRLYYAGYNVSKSIRYDSDGNHSTDVKDHAKVGALPDGFSNKATYENELKSLREDRNSCDYDHMIKAPDLLQSTSYYQALISRFLRDAHDHLSARGVILEKKI